MKLVICVGLAGAATVLAAAPAFAETWDLFHREAWVQDRIQQGRQNGSLDPSDAQRSLDALKKIEHDEQFDMRTNNGQLSAKDRSAIEARLDDLSDHVHGTKVSDVRRPW